LTKPLYFYNGSTFELVGPTTPQSPIAYQTSAPTAPATGDIWIDSDGDVDTYNRQLTRYYFVATASQTTITGIDANGLTLAYVAGSEAVYVNGALQVRGQDYTATNGTSVVMTSALAVNDVVEIFAYTAFIVANAYTKSETDGVAAAAAGLRMVVPTSVAVGSGSGSVDALGNVTFSGASSVSINGCFTSLYDNYRIVTDFQAVTSDGDAALRVRASGTDLTTSTYFYGRTYLGAYSSVALGTENNINTTSVNIGSTTTTAGRGGNFDIDIHSPMLARTTGIKSWGVGNAVGFTGAVVNNTTAYDGITFFMSGQNITGTIRVYGYKD
jgi:hypothetical protein